MTAALLAVLLALPAAAAPSPAVSRVRRARLEYLRGTLLERRGAYAEALSAYEKALDADPTSAYIAGEAAGLALQLGDLGRAETWARRRLALAPGDAESRLILGRILWGRGDADGAQKELELALKDDPSSTDALFALTELLSLKEPARARRLLEDFLKRNPDQAARALLELGRLDAQQRRFGDAAAKLKRAISLGGPDADSARLALAQIYEVTSDTPSAVAEYQKLLAADPDDADLQAHIGALQDAEGRRDDARDTFRSLKARVPDDPSACAWLASDAESSGDFKAAAAYLKDSSALKDDPTLTLRLGYYELQAGGIQAAMDTLKQARRRWPDDDRIAYYLALGYDDQGDLAKSAELLRAVLALKPDDRDARWQLATTLERLGRMDEAEPEFRRLIAEKPDDAAALNYLGYALADRGEKLDEAESLIRRALQIEPANPAYRDSLGWVEFKLGRSTEAARDLASAARDIGDDGTVWEHLGAA
ncbi:MAG: tetratricopeptide repeat protein, partial [Elusimicrobia bacterium]|nr:tetratricopeptide repeat protein [Elusimicrobiota bacterium]